MCNGDCDFSFSGKRLNFKYSFIDELYKVQFYEADFESTDLLWLTYAHFARNCGTLYYY